MPLCATHSECFLFVGFDEPLHIGGLHNPIKQPRLVEGLVRIVSILIRLAGRVSPDVESVLHLAHHITEIPLLRSLGQPCADGCELVTDGVHNAVVSFYGFGCVHIVTLLNRQSLHFSECRQRGCCNTPCYSR